jgi:hypothetical protein
MRASLPMRMRSVAFRRSSFFFSFHQTRSFLNRFSHDWVLSTTRLLARQPGVPFLLEWSRPLFETRPVYPYSSMSSSISGKVIPLVHAHVLRLSSGRLRPLSASSRESARPARVVRVRPRHGRPNPYAVPVDEQAPLRSGFRPVWGVRSRAFSPERGLVLLGVHRLPLPVYPFVASYSSRLSLHMPSNTPAFLHSWS